MSKIDELLKNEKVEWKKLGEISNCFAGGTPNTSTKTYYDGDIPWIRSGEINFNVITKSERNITREGLENSSAKLIRPNSVVLAMTGATVGRSGVIEFATACNQSIAAIENDEKIVNYKYLYYFISSKYDFIKNLGQGALTSLNISIIKNLEIPIPSIETQEKIVKTLDKFTNYVTELQTELQARTKQYEYYRDMLLSEEYLNKLSNYLEENRLLKLEWKTLDEISVGSLSYGSGASAIDYDGETRYIRITDINDSGGLNKEKASPNVVEEKYILNNEDILFARSGATVGKNYIHLINDKCIYAGYLIRLIVNKEIALPKFVFYCLNTNRYKIFVDNTKSRGSQPNINAKQYGSFKIPIIPIEIQNKVVEILDKFQSLLADTKGLLPQEIEQRQKQYEYYREKLLTFDENSAKHTHTHNLISNSYFDLLKEVAEIVGVSVFAIQRRCLGEIGSFFGGISGKSKNDFINGNSKFITYKNVFSNLATNLEVEDKVNIKTGEQQRILQKGDIIFTGSSEIIEECGMSSVITEQVKDNLYLNSFCFFLRLDDLEILLPDFSKYLFRSKYVRKQIVKTASGVTRFNVSKKLMEKVEIIVPSIPVQEHIVSILDKFDSIVNDISKGLPKEIELRQKQYEYYREKLLSFKRND